MRESTGQGMGLIDPAEAMMDANQSSRILVIEDRAESVGLVRPPRWRRTHEVSIGRYVWRKPWCG